MANNAKPFGAFGFKVSVEASYELGILQKAACKVYGALNSALSGGSSGGITACGCFQEVSGLGITVTTEDRPEGGVNGTVHKLVTGTTFSNVTLKRGLCDRGMYDWIRGVISGEVTRVTVTIELLDDSGQNTVAKYTLKNAIPVQWSGPTLNVSQDAIATESLVLAYEELVVE